MIDHMLTRYHLLNGTLNYTGACGFGIGSEVYMNHLEKKIFGEKGHKYLKDDAKSGSYKEPAIRTHWVTHPTAVQIIFRSLGLF